MGTDIHLWVEYKLQDGSWNPAGAEGEYYDGVRSIPLFALLADVRISRNWDYSGSAPIAPLRGFPADLSEEVRQYMQVGAIYAELHSPTWYTLTEMLNYDWPEDLAWFKDENLRDISRLCYCTGLTPDDVRIVIAFDN
jgi:hypothetical protein